MEKHCNRYDCDVDIEFTTKSVPLLGRETPIYKVTKVACELGQINNCKNCVVAQDYENELNQE